MPPKRKQAAAATSAKSAPAKRRSKLAKDNNITADEEAEIQEAFYLFATSSESDPKIQLLATADVRRCLIALNAPAKSTEELQELLEAVDPEEEGTVSFERFVSIAALKLQSKHENPEELNEEVLRAYKLFTKDQERDITLADLRRVARDLREDVPENVLKDMIREATGGGLGGVGMDDFEGVMRRAGVFG